MSDINPAPDFPGPDHRAATPNRIISDPKIRKYLYLLAAAILAGLVVAGIITEEQIAEWARITGWVLGVGIGVLAAVNTPESR